MRLERVHDAARSDQAPRLERRQADVRADVDDGIAATQVAAKKGLLTRPTPVGSLRHSARGVRPLDSRNRSPPRLPKGTGDDARVATVAASQI
jgi:hypothetical protein